MSLNNNNPYDEQFIDPPVKKSFAERSGITPSKSNMSRVYGATSTSLLGINTGYGESKYDKGLNWYTDIDRSDVRNSLNDYRSEQQSGLTQLGAGLGRAGLKAAAEIAKLPGVIGGVAMSAFAQEGEGYDTAFNNAWIKTIDSIEGSIKEEALPVYVKKSIQEGSLIDNITSTGFWATEGADGLGFMLGMMAPGAAINKLGMGAKLLSNARKVAQFAGMAEKTEAAVSLLKQAGMTGKAIDVATGAVVNTITESGAEAAGVGNDLMDRKPEYMKQNVSKRIAQLNTTGIPEMIQAPMELIQNPDGTRSMQSRGLIPNPDFEKIREQAYTLAEEDFKEQRALAMRDTFKSNLAVLIIPNLLMSKMLFGKAESKLIKEVEKTGLKGIGQTTGKALRRTGQAFASEGLLEEASQTTAQNMFTQKAMKNELNRGDNGFITGGLNDFTIGEATDAYLDTVSSTEGQKAIFLGGMLAAPMTTIIGHKNDVRQKKETNAILDKMDLSISSFNTIFDNDIYKKDPNDENKFLYKKDEDGNDTTERLINKTKALEVAKSLNYNEAQAARLDWAISTGNKQIIQELKEKAVFDMVMPAIFNGKAGLDALEEKLNADSQFTEIANRDADPTNKDKSSDFIASTLEAARHLQAQNEKFDDFGSDLIELNDDRATPEDKKRYLNALNNQYLNVKYQQYNSEKKLTKLEEKRDKLFKELNIQRDVQDIAANARQVNNAMSTNPLLKSVIEEITEVKESIRKNIKDVNGLWSGKSAIADSFKKYIDDLKEQEEETSDEKVAEAENVIDKVTNATNKSELEKAITSSKISKEDSDEIDQDIPEVEEEEYDYFTEENEMISNEIESKTAKAKEDKNKLTKEIVSINDTIDYLTDLLNEVVGNTTEDVSDLNKEINNRIKLFNSLAKSKTKKGKINSNNVSELKENIRDAFQLANDIKDRIAQLETNKKELEKLNDFLSYKIEYYNKLKDQGLDFQSLQNKINKLEGKSKTINGLIDSIENTIQNLLNTLKEIFNIISGFEKNLNGFTEASGFSKDENDELKSIIENNPSKGSAYFNNKLSEINSDLNNALDHGEITQEVYDNKLKELENLTKVLEKTSIQLDILKDLFSNEKKEEVRKKSVVENPYIQQKIAEKEAELDRQEAEEAQEEKEFQRDLEEEEILNEESTVTEISTPNVSVDENGDVESESIPVTDDEETETSPTEFDITEEDVEENLESELSGAKVISTNRDTGLPLGENLNEFVAYERTPRDKSQDVVEFSLGDAKGEVLEAYNRALKGKATDKDVILLKGKLPIKIDISYEVIENGKTRIKKVSSFIEAESEANQSNPSSKEMFDLQTMPLRENVVNELIKNKSFKGLSTKIVKQYPGLLKVEPNVAYSTNNGDLNNVVVPKNNIFELQVFDGMSNDKKIAYFQKNSAYVDWSGNLVSTLDKNNIIRRMNQSNKGEVFLRIPRNDGSDFWLKLNVAKVSEDKAEAVFEMVKALSSMSKTIKSANKMQGMTIDTFFAKLEEQDPVLANRIMQSLEEEIELINSFDKGKAANRTLSRLIDLIVYHKSKNTKTAFNLTEDGNLELGSLAEHLIDGQGFRHQLTITKEELDSENAKQIVMDYLSYKRNNIMITADSANLFVFNNKAYIEYLLGIKSGNPILTTNAVVDQPTFQGYSNIYLNQSVSNSKSKLEQINLNQADSSESSIAKDDQSTNKNKVDQLRAEEQVKKAEIEDRRKEELNSADKISGLDNLVGGVNNEISNAPNLTWREYINAKYDTEQDQLYKEYDKLITPLLKEIKKSESKPIDLEPTDDDGTIPSVKARFQAALNGNKTSKSDKVDVDEIKDLFEKGDENAKSEAIFNVAEFLNIVDSLENVKEADMEKFFYKMIEDLNKQGKTVSEQKQICGF